MPTAERRLRSDLEDYLRALARCGRANRETVVQYRREITNALKALADAGMESTLRNIGEEEVDYLRREAWADEAPATQRWKLAILNGFLKYYGNNVIDRMMIAWPQGSRMKVDWLTPEETLRILDAARGVERIVVHLELRLGLRRVEVKRLKCSDIQYVWAGGECLGYINVHGKGRGGGKWRTIAFAPDTEAEVKAWEEERERIIEEALSQRPDQEVPQQFVIYSQHGRLGSYKDTALDRIVARAAQRAGIDRPVSNHTLRRTCGRNLHYAGVAIEEIAALFGHADTKQTMEYLGLTVEDLRKAQEKGYSFLREVRKGVRTSPLQAIRVCR
ncbi:MAG: site-specific integrase [Methanomassiliicoccales archaeon]|jgi:integrase/recombinase XerD|nr:site-specific integrase [Methanomassiliicoccales archaeon]